MFFDLNFSADDLEPFAARERSAAATTWGYRVVALNRTAVERLTAKDRCSSTVGEEAPASAAGAPGYSASKQGFLERSQGLTQLSRLTVSLEGGAAAAQLLSTPANAIAASHDILAVQPLSERVLQQACTSMDVDLIAFDLGKRLPFRLKPALLQAAVKRGLHLEICYAAALREEGSRRSCFANALALSRAVGGKGIIVSSGARSVWEMRAPHDIINLSTLFGLKQQQAQVALSERCAAVIRHSERRKAYRGAVRPIKQPAPPEKAWQAQRDEKHVHSHAELRQHIGAGPSRIVTGKRRRQLSGALKGMSCQPSRPLKARRS